MDLEALQTTERLDSVAQFSDSTRIDFPGRFSRDGDRVAFLSDRTGWAEAWVANRDGSGLHRVTTMRATELGIEPGRPMAAVSSSTRRLRATRMSTSLISIGDRPYD
jgi:hypothetical protein